MQKIIKLAIITSHPIQYYAPVFKLMYQQKKMEVKVFYTLGEVGLKQFDPGFGRSISWDIPLLKDYPYHFQKNTAKNASSNSFWGIKNPDLTKEIEAWHADTILVYGWSYQSHFKAMHYFKGKVPVFFRGDSTLLDRKNSLKNNIKNILLRWVYRHVDHAFFTGTNNKAYFKRFGLKDDQLTFAPHAIDNDRFAEDHSIEAAKLREKFNIKPEEILILFAGKLEPKKNPEILLKAFENLNQQNTHLIFVGNGPLEEELKTKKEVLKTASQIHFLDFQNQSQMPVLYQACDLFCLPSCGPGESWGLAVNEAMACGKAVLVSDQVGCAADLVFEGKNGVIFQSENAADLVQKLRHLCQHKNILVEYGTASAQIIKSWNFENSVNMMLEKISDYA